jgi:two-component system nitrogen regulation response regulator GlnG
MPRWSGWQAFDFPGNVRQLENLCHWLTVMAPAQVVEPKDLPPELMRGSAADRVLGGRAGPMRRWSAQRRPGGGGAAGSRRRRAAASPAAPSWLGDLEREARRRLEARRARGLGRADAAVRGPA